jgi:hypothetical protein
MFHQKGSVVYNKNAQLYVKYILNGFGHRNDEAVYACVRKGDVSGNLFREATRGYGFTKKYIPLILLVCYLKIVRDLWVMKIKSQQRNETRRFGR